MWSAGTEVPTQLCAVSDSFGWQPVNCVTLPETPVGLLEIPYEHLLPAGILGGGLALVFRLVPSVLGAVWVLTAAFCWRRETLSQSCWKGFLFYVTAVFFFIVENSKKCEVIH